MLLSVFLHPGAKQEKIQVQQDLEGNFVSHVRVRARPIDGEANEALLEFLAKEYKLAKSHIRLVKGHTSRYKLVAIQE